MSEHEALIWIETHECDLMVRADYMQLSLDGYWFTSSDSDVGMRLIDVVTKAIKAGKP